MRKPAGQYWIAAYPKSGGTWLRLFVAHLTAPAANRESLQDAERRVAVDFGNLGFDRALGIKLADLASPQALILKPWYLETEARSASMPAFRRTHDAWTLTALGEPQFPAAAVAGVVHLVRDPRDVAVSYADYFRCSLDQAITAMADPDHALIFDPEYGARIAIVLLDWSSHCRSWLEAPDFPRLLLRYEDLLAQPAREFERLACFAGLPSEEPALAAAIEATRFERLKAREADEGLVFRGEDRHFFRAGRAGGWRNVLSPDQARRIERRHGEMMARLGYPSDEL